MLAVAGNPESHVKSILSFCSDLIIIV
jgi:hypothetical protein